MSEFKNFETDEKKLKKADAQKMSSAEESSTAAEMPGTKKNRASTVMMPVSGGKSKRFPLVVDIIVGIVMIAIVAAILVGAYLLFRYYSNDYNGTNINYTIVVNTEEDLSALAPLSHGELYCDVNGNTLYFGKVRSIKQEDSNGVKMFVLEIGLENVRYRDGEGYCVETERIAVGTDLTLRCGEKEINGTVVEIVKAQNGVE